jgi:hypothetical protein
MKRHTCVRTPYKPTSTQLVQGTYEWCNECNVYHRLQKRYLDQEKKDSYEKRKRKLRCRQKASHSHHDPIYV